MESIPIHRSSTLTLVLDTPKGRGVFSSVPIPAGTIIETAPILLLSMEEWESHIKHTCLAHYSFNWPIKDVNSSTTVMHQAVVLGLGSMFNHSKFGQNVGWKRNIDAGLVVYTTLRDIQLGEELLISYGDKLWFEDVDDIPEKEASAEEFLGSIDAYAVQRMSLEQSRYSTQRRQREFESYPRHSDPIAS
ncbi:hypothetical protein DFH27DRAFT_152038 [Peziza echinospora]|nr:hypothetical protein DFH27DRAFT_152038 [Peziza echinospora]